MTALHYLLSNKYNIFLKYFFGQVPGILVQFSRKDFGCNSNAYLEILMEQLAMRKKCEFFYTK